VPTVNASGEGGPGRRPPPATGASSDGASIGGHSGIVPPAQRTTISAGTGSWAARSFGAAVAALCCFTPILAAGLGAIGPSARLGWLDHVLPPSFAGFILSTAHAPYRRRREAKEG